MLRWNPDELRVKITSTAYIKYCLEWVVSSAAKAEKVP